MPKPHVIGCSVYGGRNPRNGKPVGERHRWNGGGWGLGTCVYCGRDLDQVLARPAPKLTLQQALVNNHKDASADEWRPSYWSGDMGIAEGWYIMRTRLSGGTEWLKDATGAVVRADSEASALSAITGLLTEVHGARLAG